MKNSIKFLLLLSSTLNLLYANQLHKAFENIQTNGYLRSAYEIHKVKNDKTYKDGAIGGKVHIQTAPLYGISLGSSFYASNALGTSDNRGLVPFRGEVARSYAILGEAYLEVNIGKTLLKIGRQELNTPFAQMDDIGMVPNTFEAYILQNKEIQNTTLFLGQIQKMSGVDAQVVDQFTSINGNNNMQTVGIEYEGLKNLTVSLWYAYLKNATVNTIYYIETDYQISFSYLDFSIGLQYAKEEYLNQKDASIFGLSTSTTFTNLGLTLAIAYNKSNDNASFSGFGGGPFFANSEYLIIDNIGKNGSQLWFGGELDASLLNINDLTFGLHQAILTNEAKQESHEIDFTINYQLSEDFAFQSIYSHLNGSNIGEDNANHLRIFVNYLF